MGAGFARMNNLTIIQATQGLYSYLQSSFPLLQDMGVIIGHDHRFHSQEFAKLTAAVFLIKNVKVYFYRKLVHTPLVPFGVKRLGAAAGIMITASHNPKDDNGYKVYWSNGCQIIPPHDHNIAQCIAENQIPWTWDATLVDMSNLVQDPYPQLFEKYFSEIAALASHKESNSKTPITFAYTAMHGVGLPFAQEAFKRFNLPPFHIVQDQAQPDPSFPTVKFPNPEEKGALDIACQNASQLGAKIVLANDPDADRLAVAELQSRYALFSSHFLSQCIKWRMDGLQWQSTRCDAC